jgi:hypothetical protein
VKQYQLLGLANINKNCWFFKRLYEQYYKKLDFKTREQFIILWGKQNDHLMDIARRMEYYLTK